MTEKQYLLSFRGRITVDGIESDNGWLGITSKTKGVFKEYAIETHSLDLEFSIAAALQKLLREHEINLDTLSFNIDTRTKKFSLNGSITERVK